MNRSNRASLATSAVLGLAAALGCSPADGKNGAESHESGNLCVATAVDGKRARLKVDVDEGRIVTASHTLVVDPVLRTMEVWGNEGGFPIFYWRETFDEHGRRTMIEDRTGGAMHYANEYEGDRLVRTTFDAPEQRQITVYAYDNEQSPSLWTQQRMTTVGSDFPDVVLVRTLANGRPERVERIFAGEHEPHLIWTYAYEDDRLVTLERITNFAPEPPNDTPDMRHSWFHDTAGRVTAWEQDGVDTYVAYIDGKPDLGQSFSTPCADLLERFPWIARIPDVNAIGAGGETPSTFPEF